MLLAEQPAHHGFVIPGPLVLGNDPFKSPPPAADIAPGLSGQTTPAGTDAGHFVTESVQRLPGVKDTFTLIAFKAF